MLASLSARARNFSLVVPGSLEKGTVSRKEMFLINHDLKPVPPAERTWKARNYVGFWVADGFNLSSMMIASTGYANGLSWWAAWLAVWLGYSLTAIFIVLNARTGAVHHIGFPVLARSSFGLFGSLWPVLNRVVLACVWFGFQSWVGGECMSLVLRSWAPKYETVGGQLSGTNTPDFVAFFLFWLLQFPTTFVSPQKIKHLFTAKAVAMPIAAFGLFGWVVAKAEGLGPIIKEPSKVSGSTFGWYFVIAVMSQMSNMVTLATNVPDWARLSSKPTDVVLPQLITIPLVFSITSLIGIFISSSSLVLFGVPTWNPLTVMSGLLDEAPYDAGTRAGVFFIASAFIIAQMGTNVAANSLSAGSDLTALLPRYITIRRGQVLCALIGLAICPWNFASSSSSFSSYLSAYSVLLAPILGVLLADSYIVRRGRIDVPSLYSTAPSSSALYYRGVNWRAYAAYLVGCALNLPGFAQAVHPAYAVPTGLVHLYDLAFLSGSLTAAACYVLFTAVKPVPGAVPLSTRGWFETQIGEDVDEKGRPFVGGDAAVPGGGEDEEGGLAYAYGDVGARRRAEEEEKKQKQAGADVDADADADAEAGKDDEAPQQGAKPRVGVEPYAA